MRWAGSSDDLRSILGALEVLIWPKRTSSAFEHGTSELKTRVTEPVIVSIETSTFEQSRRIDI